MQTNKVLQGFSNIFMEDDHSAFYYQVAIIQMQYDNKNLEMQTMHTLYNKGSQTQMALVKIIWIWHTVGLVQELSRMRVYSQVEMLKAKCRDHCSISPGCQKCYSSLDALQDANTFLMLKHPKGCKQFLYLWKRKSYYFLLL